MNPIDFLVDKMMLPILESAHNITGSYGWAIVFLTVIIRMVLLPLTMQSHFSMREMQKIQPKLKKIQERYKGKPEELNKRMVALYKEHKVNPLGGCLPLVIQMPFLFALYRSLIGKDFTAMLKASGHTSFLFLSDLAKVGVYVEGKLHFDNILLLAAFTISTIVQQKYMTPAAAPDADPRQAAVQKQMKFMMPIMITVMFLIIPVPTGIYLYLVISNLIGIAQYAFLNHQSERRDAKQAEAIKSGTAQNTAKVRNEVEDENSQMIDAKTESNQEKTPESDANKHRVKKGTKKKKRRK